jgi:outer membrane protein assembly factor BamB
LRTGDDLWVRDLPAAVTAAPSLASGTLYLGTEGGELLCFDARSGQLLFRDRVGSGAVQASPLPVADSVVVAALDGTVAAYR